MLPISNVLKWMAHKRLATKVAVQKVWTHVTHIPYLPRQTKFGIFM